MKGRIVIMKLIIRLVLGFIIAQTARAKIVETFHLDTLDRALYSKPISR